MAKIIGIMGESGSGKNTSMRNLDPTTTYYIDCDKKGLSWRGWKKQYNAEAKNYFATDQQNLVLAVMQGINKERPNIKTIVIDTLGELVNFMLKYFADKDKSLITRGGTLNIKVWGLVKTEFESLKLKLHLLNKHLIFVSHVKEDKDGENKVYRMDVAGSTSETVTKILDFLGFCEVLGKTRSISFTPSARFYAKNSIELNDYLEIPQLKTGDKNDFLTKEVIEPTIAKRKQESEALKINEEKLQQGRYLIEQATEPNAVLTAFKEMDLSIYNKKVLFNELSEKFSGYKFDNKKGEFICQ